jgi:hypothetical protein
LQKRNKLLARWDGQACMLQLDYPDTNEPMPDLGRFTCQPMP